MDSVDRTAMMEHLALESPLSLNELCAHMRQLFDLPEFRFDSENETEWGLVEVYNLKYNVSRPYEDGRLQKRDDTVPAGCNFGVSLIVYREHPRANDYNWAVRDLVAPIAQQMADSLRIPVHHHRSWRGPGKNIRRNRCFHPTAT